MSKRINIQLIQPRHIYAPLSSKNRIGHVYMPTSLLTAAARILIAGGEVSICDENLNQCHILSNTVGINLVGSPYVPVAIGFRDRLRKQFGKEFNLLLGGQVVSGFSIKQLNALFGNNVLDGNHDEILTTTLGIKSTDLPASLNTSLIPSYELLSNEQ